MRFYESIADKESQRNHPDRRGWFFAECRNWLDERQAEYRILTGGWEERFRQAVEAVDPLLRD